MMCAARFCTDPVEHPKTFCEGHWDRLPMELKERLADTFKTPEHDGRQPNPKWAMGVTVCIGFLQARGKA